MLFQTSPQFLLAASLLPALVLSKTNLSGCAQTTTVSMGTSTTIWYDPCSGEICSVPVCDVNKSTVTDNPACPDHYSGTMHYAPSYLTGYSTVPDSYTASCGNALFTAVETTTRTVMSALTSSSSTSPAPGPFTIIFTPTPRPPSASGHPSNDTAKRSSHSSYELATASGRAITSEPSSTNSPSATPATTSAGASISTSAAAPSQYTEAAAVGKYLGMIEVWIAVLAAAFLF
jgi:cobalamin biosynthesis Mg chelatase CobN